MSDAKKTAELSDKVDMASRLSNIAVSAVLLIVAIVFLVTVATTLRITDRFGPGPGFVPMLGSMLCVLGSLYILVQSFRGVFDGNGDIRIARPRKTLVFIGSTIFSLLLVPVIGLLSALALMQFLIYVFVEGVQPWRAAIVSICITFSTYLLLVKLLALPMPQAMFTLF